MTIGDGDLDAVRAKCQVVYSYLARLKPGKSARIQIVDQDLTIRMSERNPSAIGAESGTRPLDGARLGNRDRVLIDVPDRERIPGKMCRRQVATVGAEGKYEDATISTRLEPGDLMIVVDRTDEDRTRPEPQCVSVHCRIEAKHRGFGGLLDHAPGCFQVRQSQTSDCLIADPIESIGR